MEAHSIWQKLQSKLSVFLNFGLTYLNSYCFIMRITSYLCMCVQTCISVCAGMVPVIPAPVHLFCKSHCMKYCAIAGE